MVPPLHWTSPKPEDAPIDDALLNALRNYRDRPYVLHLEETVKKFVRTSGPDEMLTFPVTGVNYQRMLAHKVAQYYQLKTATMEGAQGSQVLATRASSANAPTSIKPLSELMASLGSEHEHPFSERSGDGSWHGSEGGRYAMSPPGTSGLQRQFSSGSRSMPAGSPPAAGYDAYGMSSQPPASAFGATPMAFAYPPHVTGSYPMPGGSMYMAMPSYGMPVPGMYPMAAGYGGYPPRMVGIIPQDGTAPDVMTVIGQDGMAYAMPHSAAMPPAMMDAATYQQGGYPSQAGAASGGGGGAGAGTYGTMGHPGGHPHGPGAHHKGSQPGGRGPGQGPPPPGVHLHNQYGPPGQASSRAQPPGQGHGGGRGRGQQMGHGGPVQYGSSGGSGGGRGQRQPPAHYGQQLLQQQQAPSAHQHAAMQQQQQQRMDPADQASAWRAARGQGSAPGTAGGMQQQQQQQHGGMLKGERRVSSQASFSRSSSTREDGEAAAAAGTAPQRPESRVKPLASAARTDDGAVVATAAAGHAQGERPPASVAVPSPPLQQPQPPGPLQPSRPPPLQTPAATSPDAAPVTAADEPVPVPVPVMPAQASTTRVVEATPAAAATNTNGPLNESTGAPQQASSPEPVVAQMVSLRVSEPGEDLTSSAQSPPSTGTPAAMQSAAHRLQRNSVHPYAQGSASGPQPPAHMGVGWAHVAPPPSPHSYGSHPHSPVAHIGAGAGYHMLPHPPQYVAHYDALYGSMPGYAGTGAYMGAPESPAAGISRPSPRPLDRSNSSNGGEAGGSNSGLGGGAPSSRPDPQPVHRLRDHRAPSASGLTSPASRAHSSSGSAHTDGHTRREGGVFGAKAAQAAAAAAAAVLLKPGIKGISSPINLNMHCPPGHRRPPPDSVLCPVSGKIMKDPVIVLASGYTYDRGSIEGLISDGKGIDPMTGAEFNADGIRPNMHARTVVQEWVRLNPSSAPPSPLLHGVRSTSAAGPDAGGASTAGAEVRSTEPGESGAAGDGSSPQGEMEAAAEGDSKHANTTTAHGDSPVAAAGAGGAAAQDVGPAAMPSAGATDDPARQSAADVTARAHESDGQPDHTS